MDNHNTSPLVSVIIPIYNAQKYIKQCVESVLNQTFSDIECILVNDGSSDRSLEICESIALLDNRVILISQVNGGVSKARNTGLEIAKGKWIMFVDSDDWIDIKAIEQGLAIAMQYDAEIVSWNLVKGHRREDMSPRTIIRIGQKEIKFFVLDLMVPRYDFVTNEVIISVGHTRSSCAKLFNSKICKNVRFETNLPLAEDAFFCNQVYQRANTVIFFNEYLYHYRANQNSAVYKYRPDIEYINEVIYESFNRNSPPYLSNLEAKVYTLGIIYECLHNLFVYKYFHKENNFSFKEKLQGLKNFVNSDMIIEQENLPREIYIFFPLQQKIALFLMFNKRLKLLLAYWFIKSKVSHVIKG